MKRIKIRSQEVKAIETIDWQARQAIIEKLIPEYEGKGIEETQDLIQDALLDILEKSKVFNDLNHFENHLRWRVNKRSINVIQQKERLLSLEDSNEKGDSYHIHMGYNDYLEQWVISQKNSKGKTLLTDLEQSVFKGVYSDGKTNLEIANETETTIDKVKKARVSLNRKLMKLPIKDMADSKYYQPSGGRIADCYKRTDIEPSEVVWDEEKGRNVIDKSDSARARMAHARALQSCKSKHLYSMPACNASLPAGKITPLASYHYQLDRQSAKHIEATKAQAEIARAVRFWYQRLDQIQRQVKMNPIKAEG